MKQTVCLMLVSGALTWAQSNVKGILPPTQSLGTNVELTVYVVSGLANPPAGTKDEIPPDLTSMLQQLHGVFMYKNYKLVDEFTLRSRNGGGAEIGGELSYFTGGQYDFKYVRARVSRGGNNPAVVHIDGLRLQITRRTSPALNSVQSTVALVETDLDMTEGQKTVVGKSAMNGDALFLVVVPKVIVSDAQ